MKHTPVIRAWVIAGIFGLAAGLAQPASAITTDTLLGSDTVGNSLDDEKDALASFLGVSSDDLILVSKDDSPTLNYLDNPDPTADQFYFDIAPDTTGFFVLKFGTGGLDPSIDSHYFFQNIAELSLLVFENSQVNNLIDIGDLLSGGTSETRLSHFLIASVIPIPATLPLFLTGLLGLGFLARRRREMAEA